MPGPPLVIATLDDVRAAVAEEMRGLREQIQRLSEALDLHERYARTLITSADVMARYGIAHTTLWTWIKEGLPALTIEGIRGYRYRLADVEAWLLNRAVTTGGSSTDEAA